VNTNKPYIVHITTPSTYLQQKNRENTDFFQALLYVVVRVYTTMACEHVCFQENPNFLKKVKKLITTFAQVRQTQSSPM